jgi:hypothetical protein
LGDEIEDGVQRWGGRRSWSVKSMLLRTDPAPVTRKMFAEASLSSCCIDSSFRCDAFGRRIAAAISDGKISPHPGARVELRRCMCKLSQIQPTRQVV